jgi:hypothetical protein
VSAAVLLAIIGPAVTLLGIVFGAYQFLTNQRKVESRAKEAADAAVVKVRAENDARIDAVISEANRRADKRVADADERAEHTVAEAKVEAARILLAANTLRDQAEARMVAVQATETAVSGRRIAELEARLEDAQRQQGKA